MYKTRITHIFLLFFLTLAVVLPISSTFLFLAGSVLSGLGDPEGYAFFTRFGLSVSIFWLVSLTVLILIMAIEHLESPHHHN